MFSLIPATIWVVIGYVVLYLSTKTDGGMRIAGRLLSVWVFIVALFIPLFGAYITLKGNCLIDDIVAALFGV